MQSAVKSLPDRIKSCYNQNKNLTVKHVSYDKVAQTFTIQSKRKAGGEVTDTWTFDKVNEPKRWWLSRRSIQTT